MQENKILDVKYQSHTIGTIKESVLNNFVITNKVDRSATPASTMVSGTLEVEYRTGDCVDLSHIVDHTVLELMVGMEKVYLEKVPFEVSKVCKWLLSMKFEELVRLDLVTEYIYSAVSQQKGFTEEVVCPTVSLLFDEACVLNVFKGEVYNGVYVVSDDPDYGNYTVAQAKTTTSFDNTPMEECVNVHECSVKYVRIPPDIVEGIVDTLCVTVKELCKKGYIIADFIIQPESTDSISIEIMDIFEIKRWTSVIKLSAL